MSARPSAYGSLLVQAQAYGEAVYFARAEVFEQMCHDRFQMTHVDPDGTTFWDKSSYLDRVRARTPFEGDAAYRIMGVDIAGNDMARVHLWVDVPPKRYEDHLGFIREGGSWKLLTKVFRTMGGSAATEV
ncbi:MAG: nuclear transport factor 2 family protein [Pseudomonadota bacterium]